MPAALERTRPFVPVNPIVDFAIRTNDPELIYSAIDLAVNATAGSTEYWRQKASDTLWAAMQLWLTADQLAKEVLELRNAGNSDAQAETKTPEEH